jgi:hypothetical protein
VRRWKTIVLLTAALAVGSAGTAAAAPGVAPPTGLTATAVSAREAVLTWNPADQAAMYRVLWGVLPTDMITLDHTEQTTYRHSYLAPGMTYVYAVQTISRRGALSAPSAVVSVTTPPEAPGGLQAEVVKADQVRLSWFPGSGATSYAVSVVVADGSETPATVLESHERGALVQTVASTEYTFRVRSVANGLASIDHVAVSVTTPAREPSVINLTAPSPVPAGDAVLTFRIDGTQTLQPTSGTLDVSINGGPVTRVPVEQSQASLPVTLAPGTHSVAAAYSGDGAFLPSSASQQIFAAPPVPAFATEVINPSTEVHAVASADVTCDGLTDLVAGHASRIDVHRGRPDGTFAPALGTALPAGTVAHRLATGDLDRNGCADVATVLGTELWTFQGSAAGLGHGTRVRGADAVNVVALHDLTGDGVLDAVVGGGGVSVLPGNGRGGFGRASRIVAAEQGFDVGDLDGDGRLDVVTVEAGQLHAWGQSATGSFDRRWTSPFDAGADVLVDDVTGDGRAEIVVTANGGLDVRSGLDGRTQATVPGIYWPPSIAAAGDVDGDGVRDLVSVDGPSGGFGVSLTWAGGPTAQQYVRTDPMLFGGVRDHGLLVADVTQDGRADVVAVTASWGLLVVRQL